jgi:phage-related minor tail protein
MMADHETEIGRLEQEFAGLEGALQGVEGVTAAFRRELEGVGGSLKDAGAQASGMSRTVTASLSRAFEGLVFDGKRASETFATLGRSLSSAVLTQALAPVQKSVGAALSVGVQAILGGLSPFAKGAAFASGRVAGFARGGVVDGPTHFPMRGGVGLMGEAGPEAIVPLARGADGRLGVRSSGGGAGAVYVTMNVSTPDAEGFRRSQSQIAAEMTRALRRGRRNL